MPDERSLPPVLEALRSHVTLERPVSDALTALHGREGESLSAVLTEARDLALRLEPDRERGAQSLLDLEDWLGAVLRGPHDERWFDERLRSSLRGWSDLPHVVCVLVIGRVRQRLTAIATATSAGSEPANEGIADAIARLFDLELALMQLRSRVAGAGAPTPAEEGGVSDVLDQVSSNIRNALAVIETSAYLVHRHSERIAPGHARIEHHLGRIVKHVHRTHHEVARLVETARVRRVPAN
jgi:hypothetical protein